MKRALLLAGLFVLGALVAGLTSLYLVLPDSATPCGDECGGRALATAFKSALGGALFFLFAGICLMRHRARDRS